MNTLLISILADHHSKCPLSAAVSPYRLLLSQDTRSLMIMTLVVETGLIKNEGILAGIFGVTLNFVDSQPSIASKPYF